MGLREVLVITISLHIVLGQFLNSARQFDQNSDYEKNQERQKQFDKGTKQVKSWNKRTFTYPFQPKSTKCGTGVCIPECANDGDCVGTDVCSCRSGFKGPRCEIVDACDSRQTGFEKFGNIECNDHPEFGYTHCVMKCFDNGKLKGPRESTCHYGNGRFIPPIGTCIYPNDVSQKPIEPSIEPTIYQLYTNNKAPPIRSAMCATWSGTNVKTFDGTMFKAPLSCSQTLILDQNRQTFGVVIKACPFESRQNCSLTVQIYFKRYLFTLRNNGGRVQLSTPHQNLPLPYKLEALLQFKPVGSDIQVDFLQEGLILTWNKHKYVSIMAEKQINHGRLGGICGFYDGSPKNDFTGIKGNRQKTVKEFVDSWRVQEIDKSPQNECLNEKACDVKLKFFAGCPDEVKAEEICRKLIVNNNMEECVKIFNLETLISSCIDDYCNCPNKYDPQSCICESMDMLVRHCKFYGLEVKRPSQICQIECENPLVWRCGPKNEPTCGSEIIRTNAIECEEGCFCPENTIRYKDTCVVKKQCPCIKGSKEYPTRSTIQQQCNTCTCNEGSWKCTNKNCGKRFTGFGDPHYTTFDGTKYDFMGKGFFYLLKTDNLTVLGENSYCNNHKVSCTSSLKIITDIGNSKETIKLLQHKVVHVNDKPVTKFPQNMHSGEIIIKQEGQFVTVKCANGVRILWNGGDTFHIDVPGALYDNTMGLGGTLNGKTGDDFLTPEGDVEISARAFGEKWKVRDTDGYLSDDPGTASDDTVDEEELEHPCEEKEERIEFAQKLCDLLESDIFLDCRDNVDPTEYRDNCMFDGCACGDNITQCYCPVFSAYADECSRLGSPVLWRDRIKECAIKCPVGQVYVECGDSCIQTCDDFLTTNGTCELPCIAGCRCPEGQYLNDKDECVPSMDCPCTHEEIVFNSGYKEVRPGKDALELCICEGGAWQCQPSGPEDHEKYPPFSEIRKKCSNKPAAEFSLCIPIEPKTCSNMLDYTENLEDCKYGCMCKESYAYDDTARLCVQPEDCSCHHGGKMFAKGDKINEDCNVCFCNSGRWKCTTHKCEGICSVWGDSHFTTFDHLDFDFQGECDYVLSRGVAENGDSFSITIQNVLCGTMGVTCSKSLKIVLNGSITDTITLSKNTPLLEEEYESKLPFEKLLVQLGNKRDTYNVYKAGVFIILEIIPLKIQIKWDEGTRIYVRLGTDWASKVDGLCGNHNENSNDDMKTPAHDLQTNPLQFGHSWKLNELCMPPTEPIDSCEEHPERSTWAKSKCNIMKSSLFKACHSVVPFEKYLKRCIFDTCACDQGGDCECLCTAIAAYAHSCSMQGIHIRWRTQHLCPMQCGRQWAEYEACTPVCGVETCDNLHVQVNPERMCLKENCLEGCLVKPCDEGMIYLNDSFTECVPKSNCKPICMKKNGKVFYEGDVTFSNECQTCLCIKKQEVCNEKPCAEQLKMTETTLYTELDTTVESYTSTERSHVKPTCPNGMKATITGQLATRTMAEIYSLTKHRSNEILESKKHVEDILFPLPQLESSSNDIEQYTEYLCMHDASSTVFLCPENYNQIKSPRMRPGEFACILRPHKDNICELSGRSFTCFDGTEFKYDVCSHILARSLINSSWHIAVQIKCTKDAEDCRKEVIIKDIISDSILIIRPNLEVQINELIRSPESLKIEPLATQSGYILSQPGDSILVVRPLHGFWVLYDKMGRIKIGVSEKFIKTVDGLCGYFSGKKEDDMRLPGGTRANNTTEFGDSWYDKKIPKDKCQPQVYAENIRKAALDICNTIEHPSFAECDKTVNSTKFIAQCIETTSECLKTSKDNTQICKCSVLQGFVAQCLVMNPKIQLNTWRAVHKCDMSCPAPMVYSDCNKRRCQPICDKLYGSDCTMLSDTCFSGCYCPEGTLRKGDTCIPVNECKDCLCDFSKHLLYDQKNFTTNGKCTYLLSKNIVLPGVHTFKVFVTMDYCKILGLPSMGNKPICVKSLRILHGDHMIHIQRVRPDQPLQSLIDGIELNQIPFKDTWLDITKTNGNELKFTLVESHIVVTSSFADMTFSIQAPIGIQKFSRNNEYNCDDCNDPQLHAAKCLNEDVLINSENCIILRPDKDFCLKLLDEKIFGKCHKIIDPAIYISKCQQNMCKASQKGICKSLASYAKECNRKGICVEWRSADFCPHKCSLPLKYKPCGCPKTCATLKANKMFTVEKDDLECGAAKSEGCFCPGNMLLDNEKCVSEEMCTKCYDGVHSVGETWKRDKCTECTCNKDAKTECIEKQCPVVESICSEGFVPSKINSPDDCCTKYVCVQEPKIPVPDKCPDALLPQCGPDQIKKQRNGPDRCPRFICECKPESGCDPLPESTPLKPGEKILYDKSGCCPTQKIFCDKSTCPVLASGCENEFYDFKVYTPLGDCCPITVCTPPKSACIAEIDGIKALKNIGDKWISPANPCNQKLCTYNPNGAPNVHEATEKCNTNCPRGFEYKLLDTTKCCGTCVQTKCIFKDSFFGPGEEWGSSDNCTKYSCTDVQGQLLISSSMEVCTDVSNCPPERLENRGCCKICKPSVESLQGDCLPISLSEGETRSSLRVTQLGHGVCVNVEPIRGFTICRGFCESGTKYNAESFLQENVCAFCSIIEVKVMSVRFKCEDGHKFVKDIDIPSACGCNKCPVQS